MFKFLIEWLFFMNNTSLLVLFCVFLGGFNGLFASDFYTRAKFKEGVEKAEQAFADMPEKVQVNLAGKLIQKNKDFIKQSQGLSSEYPSKCNGFLYLQLVRDQQISGTPTSISTGSNTPTSTAVTPRSNCFSPICYK